MNAMKQIGLALCTCICVGLPLSGMAESPILPFGVELGGQTAVASGEAAIFATIKDPVSADAKITVKVETKMVIINVFACDDKGTPVQGAAPAIILINGSNEGSLSSTMDKKPIKTGTYVANIVAAGKTSRVFFKVK